MNKPADDDDDIGSLFAARREASQIKRALNRQSTPEVLKAAGIAFVSKNSGAHLIVLERFDLWAGTGLWRDRLAKREGRGVRNLIDYIKHLKES